MGLAPFSDSNIPLNCISRSHENNDRYFLLLPQIFTRLMRRYKYLEKMFEEEMKKVLIFIKGFTPLERIKLARMTALWIGKCQRSSPHKVM